MKAIGIIGALTLEVTTLLNYLQNKTKEGYAGMTFFKGTYHGLCVVISECGVGKVNAAVCAQLMIDKFSVESIINTGIAGNLNKELNICDMVLSSTVYYHDKDLEMMTRYFPFCDHFDGDEALLAAALQAYNQLDAPTYRCIKGTVATGEQFIAHKSVKQDIIDRLHPDCVEMEGGAIGHTAYINEIPFIILRSISDNADEEANMSFEAFMQKAADNSAHLVLGMLDILANGE